MQIILLIELLIKHGYDDSKAGVYAFENFNLIAFIEECALKMQKNNPACYACPKGKNKLHTWKRNVDKTAECKSCKLKLTVEQAEDVWRE